MGGTFRSMGKVTEVEINGHLYRYEYVDGQTLYKGPVGDAPTLSEEEFLMNIAPGQGGMGVGGFTFERVTTTQGRIIQGFGEAVWGPSRSEVQEVWPGDFEKNQSVKTLG